MGVSLPPQFHLSGTPLQFPAPSTVKRPSTGTLLKSPRHWTLALGGQPVSVKTGR